jgi:hypothetical protein
LKKQRAFVGAAIAAAVSGVAFPAFAVDNVWTGATDTNWNTPTNWSLGRVPTNANGAPTGDTFDDAVVNSTTVVPLISADLAATPRDIVVGSGAGTNGQVNHTAGTAATGNGNWMFVGRDGGTGKYNLGNAATTGGTLTGIGLGSGSINVSGRIYVAGHFGGAANGVLNINTTGTITTGSDINLGAANGTGTVNLDAGTVNVGGWISVGRDENGTNGTGNWNQSGGTVNVNGNTVLGLPGTHGNFNLTGGTHTVAGEFWVGNGVGNSVPSVGVANVSAGTVTVNNWIAVGREGAVGTLNVSGNGTVQKQGGGHITIGTGAGGNGTVAVSGNGTLSSNADIIVAENNPTAVAVVNQSGGRVLVGGNLDVQRNGTGTYNLSGGTLSVDGRTPDDPASQVLGIDGRQGTFTFTGGRITRSNAGVITYVGDLHVGNKAAGFKLDTDKTFAVGGLLDVAPGVTFDVTGRTIPAHTGGGFETGSFPLGTDNSILGTFDPSTTSVLGLNNLAGATFISEAAGEGHTYSDTQRVFWVQESAGQVSLQYSVAAAPEPGTIALLALSGVTLLTRRRRK